MLSNFFNLNNLENIKTSFLSAKPFNHIVIDNFLKEDIAHALGEEIPGYNDEFWHQYNNPIEIKKVCNDWNRFPSLTYRFFSLLNSAEFTSFLAQALGLKELYSDNGLNGGGWHLHARGGKLNTHLDYSIHPKLNLQRKINIIIYLNSAWDSSWGGELGLWEHDQSQNGPGKLAKEVIPLFNRAIIFDTTQNSWHGLPSPLKCPEGQARKSIAVYYLQSPPQDIDPRGKALFAPTEDQKDNKEVLDLIKIRSDVKTASDVYKKK